MVMDDNWGESNSRSEAEPAWVSATLRLLPAPVFAVTAAIGCLIVAVIFLIQALIHGDNTYWCLFGLFVFSSAVISAASIKRRRRQSDSDVSISVLPRLISLLATAAPSGRSRANCSSLYRVRRDAPACP